LYEEAFFITDPGKRAELYEKMDRIVMEEAPVVPLYYDMVVRFTPNNIQGFSPNPMNNLVLKTVWKSQDINLHPGSL
jgi:ABC-type transport system substrate-binding protein